MMHGQRNIKKILFQFSSFTPKPKWTSQDRTWATAVGGRRLTAYS